MPAAPATHRGVLSSLRPRRDMRARACVRAHAIPPRRPDSGVSGREKETEAGARKDTALGKSRPPRVKSEVPARP